MGEEAAADSRGQNALENLDIDAQDQVKLANILDADHTGAVNLLELMTGLTRLRGTLVRSDRVSVDLACQRLIENTDEILDCLLNSLQSQDSSPTNVDLNG